MRKLRELEDLLIRAESALAVALVLVMLVLAGYNVVYRNVLVPLQQRWAHSGPPVASEPAAVETAPEADAKAPPEPEADAKAPSEPEADAKSPAEPEVDAKAPSEPEADGGADDFGGFGGGFDDDGGGDADAAPKDDEAAGDGLEPEAPKEEAKPEPGSDDFGGFGGGFGDEDEPAPEPEAKPEPEPEPEAKAEPAADAPKADEGADDGGGGAEGFGGFGGGFGDDEPADEPADEGGGAEGFGGGFGDDGAKPEAKADEAKADEAKADELDDELDDIFGEDDEDPFANLAEIDTTAKKDAGDVLQGGPPPEGSWQAKAIAFIDAVKLDWIDIFLRQLVIMVSFLGAMLATQRSKHINIDALSKVLPPKARRVVGMLIPLVAISVCLVFASAGWDLVQISREFPTDLLPWAEDWVLQLMFPVGFGLLALHFGVRLVEAVMAAPPEPEPRPKAATEPQRLDDGGDDEEDEDDDGGGAESDDDAPDRSTGDDDAASAAASSEGGPR